MDNKKQQNYSKAGSAKTNTTDARQNQKSSSDLQSNKYWPKSSRRRENPQNSSTLNSNNNSSKQQQQQQSAKVRPNVDKRPRARGYISNNHGFGGTSNDYFASSSGLVSEYSTVYASPDEGALGRYESNNAYEVNSIYSPGSKKQNLNHLLNFYYTPKEVDHHDGSGQRLGHVKKHKYNKEQFLQANFQFVIKASAKRKTNDSPDTLIDWTLIEQINIQTPDEPQCPICLYPPVAAKVTRCGHVYCWPCVLQYLSLSDKTWRKCPICYDAVHVGDLKSASIVQQKSFNVGSQITFRLMRRKKGSLLIEKYESWNYEGKEKYPYVSSPMDDKLFSKFILAKRSDIADILARERQELLADVDDSCPEFVFVQQAMELLRERSDNLGEIETRDGGCDVSSKENAQQHENDEHLNIDDVDNVGQSNKDTADIDHQPFEKVDAILTKVEPNAEGSITEASNDCTSSQSLKKFYYFYQVDDGQNIFLHPINVKMLQACYGSLLHAPPTIKACILQKEQNTMDEEHRRKFTCLGHLPLTCQFSVVEIELQPPYVTEDIVMSFKPDIIHRKKERQRRAREEREREKHIDAINDRQMGKLIATTAKINIKSSHEFPICGFEESLLHTTELADNIPSTSKGSRKKTTSTSSAGSCSYSSIAMHCQKEHSPWATVNATQLKSPAVVVQSEDDDATSILNSIQTNFGDVLAQALSQKNQNKSDKVSTNTNASSNGNKKSKKSKKMVPLYSTGMNFSGN